MASVGLARCDIGGRDTGVTVGPGAVRGGRPSVSAGLAVTSPFLPLLGVLATHPLPRGVFLPVRREGPARQEQRDSAGSWGPVRPGETGRDRARPGETR